MQNSRILTAVIARNVLRRNCHGHDDHESVMRVLKPVATMDDTPVPQGSWQRQYDANQRKYNSHLIFGTLFLIGTIVFGRMTGDLWFNALPPKRPVDKNDYFS